MSFVAAIDEPRNISSWARACTSLAGVSEQVTFTVSAKAVTMLAVNASKTTHGEIGFERGFFKLIKFDTEGIIEDGFSESDSTYSFVVSSKHLVMLLKNSDPLTFNYVCLKVECSSSTPSLRQFKLEVEILAKSLVLKKYQIGFLPVEYKGTDIPARYDMLWHENDLSKFTIEAPIIKSFLDTAHASAEDFGVETRSSNIIFTAYTKQVVKDRDFLKQPMSISIQMAIDDLNDSNLGDTKVCLNFRLRDFRNFISLVWSLRALDGSNLDRESLCFDALFGSAGDPILLRHESESLSIKFIQMTTDDSGNVSKQDAKTYVITAPIVQKGKPLTQRVRRNPRLKRPRGPERDMQHPPSSSQELDLNSNLNQGSDQSPNSNSTMNLDVVSDSNLNSNSKLMMLSMIMTLQRAVLHTGLNMNIIFNLSFPSLRLKTESTTTLSQKNQAQNLVQRKPVIGRSLYSDEHL